jgi:hypothetical protein
VKGEEKSNWLLAALLRITAQQTHDRLAFACRKNVCNKSSLKIAYKVLARWRLAFEELSETGANDSKKCPGNVAAGTG